MAPIRHIVAWGSDSWIRGLVLCLTVRLNLVRECAALLIVGSSSLRLNKLRRELARSSLVG